MDKGDDEYFSIRLLHQQEPYSLAKCREKHDPKAPKRYGFVDMVSFALVTGSRNP
jgi:hypothetical protein